MTWIVTPDAAVHRPDVIGGKAWRLGRLQNLGYPTPDWLCVTTYAYNTFLDATGLRERIALELHRKVFEEMRWEEIWDCALRIRHLFQSNPMPEELAIALSDAIDTHFGDLPVAVRSSATDEDHRQSSFAGLHDSYINVRGTAAIVAHIVKVWTSLWSDAALLYRKEIGLDISQSAMAVLVQRFVDGSPSGVAFTRHPTQPDHMAIEAVHGLNQGLVDGDIEPDRWVVRREDGKIASRTEVERQARIVVQETGVRQSALPKALQDTPPLTNAQVSEVADVAMEIEHAFGTAQDMEWTFDEDRLAVLQARDVTTLSGSGNDQRGWYLSLHKSYEQLIQLRKLIENEHIPAMIDAAAKMAKMDIMTLSTSQLVAELKHRWDLNQHWSAVYWSDFIPYAHGVRLFGQFYNDAVNPKDPYAFMDLLTQTNMESMQRNNMLQELADMLLANPGFGQNLSPSLNQNAFEKKLSKFLVAYGDLSTAVTGRQVGGGDVTPLIRLLKQMGVKSSTPIAKRAATSSEDLRKTFLNRFSGQARERAEAMLDLARNSYQLRDDDNIHLSRIEAQLLSAVDEARRRLPDISIPEEKEALSKILEKTSPETKTTPQQAGTRPQPGFQFRQRQLVGQPAGPGVSKGIARVINEDDQLTMFKAGEILVCDAVDPNMTFVVPLAAGIVERRGGMLIHGAIIAREYGLPCITGVPHATSLIRSGDTITVDGYLGIVTLD